MEMVEALWPAVQTYIFPALLVLLGVTMSGLALKNHPFLMQYRKAREMTRLIGEDWTRIFYFCTGILAIAAGVAIYLKDGRL